MNRKTVNSFCTFHENILIQITFIPGMQPSVFVEGLVFDGKFVICKQKFSFI